MTRIKGLYVTNKKKSGKPVVWYVYAWRGGPCILKKVGGKRPDLGPDELDLYNKAIADAKAVKPDMLAGLIRDYLVSPEWAKLAVTTRRNWIIIVRRIEDKWGSTPLAFWNDPRMVTKVVA